MKIFIDHDCRDFIHKKIFTNFNIVNQKQCKMFTFFSCNYPTLDAHLLATHKNL